MKTQTLTAREGVPLSLRPALLPVAKRVFWWGNPEEWLADRFRFVAQVMTYGDWDDARITLAALGDVAFQEVLQAPPPGVFDKKSWNFWHVYYHRAVPPMPMRQL